MILSLAEKLGAKTLRPPKPPVVLPNTNYFLWFFLVLAVMLFSLLCIAVIRLPELVRKYRAFRKKLEFYKNAVRTKRLLNILLKKKISDSEFCESWQKIVRAYLEFRFKISFASVTGRNIEKKIQTVTGGYMTDRQEENIELLTSLFVRTDYIRFAEGSIDSKMLPMEEHQASFLKGEKKSMISSMHGIIDTFEKEEADD